MPGIAPVVGAFLPKYRGAICSSRGLRSSSVRLLSSSASRSGAPVTRMGARPSARVAGPGGRLSTSARDMAMLSWCAARLTTRTCRPASLLTAADSDASLMKHSMVPDPPKR